MANSWIETNDFEINIRLRFEYRFNEAGVTGSPYRFASILAGMARENLPIFNRRGEQERSPSEALNSVDDIAGTAISIARRANRSYVNEEDLSEAIQSRFCRIWPFCR
jgi:hypothetical protein